MTVFKGFLTVAKQNIGTLIMYLAIFLTICLTIQKITGGDTQTTFEAERLDIAVIDHDGKALAQGLTEYLSHYHNIKELPDDKGILQERLFYREVYYVVTIPDNFEELCLNGDEKLSVTKVPGSNSGYYVDQQINTFLNDVRILTFSGFSLTEAISEVQDNASIESDVSMIDKNGLGGQMPGHAFMFQYMPYILMSILCYALSFIMIAFNKPDIRRRMLCSAVSSNSQNLQLVLGFMVIGLAVWAICAFLPVLVYRDAFLQDAHLPYYLINSLIMTLVSLTMAFLVGTLVHREETVSAVVNVLTLGMSFLCGVFVSMDILSKGIKTVAHFLPAYWYEINNSLLASNGHLSQSQFHSLLTSYGIQLLFAAAFLVAALVIGRHRRQI